MNNPCENNDINTCNTKNEILKIIRKNNNFLAGFLDTLNFLFFSDFS